MTSAYNRHKVIYSAVLSRNCIIIMLATAGILPVILCSGYYLPYHDSVHQIYPFILETKRMLASGAPLWSWDTYLGDNFIASYAYYTLTSPFVWLCCLMPVALMPVAFTISLYLKLLVCGWITDRYLRMLGFSKALCLIGSLMYTFSQWSISNLDYFSFLEPMIAFPLVLLSIERYIQGRKLPLTGLILSLCAAALLNFYFIPCTYISAFIYYVFRTIGGDKPWTSYLKGGLAYVLCNVLAIMMSAVIIIPAFLQLQGSPRIDFHIISPFSYYLERVLTLIIPKFSIGPYGLILIRPYWDCVGITPAMFGILPLIILVLKKVFSWPVRLSLALIIIYITPLNGIFSLFTNPDYCRWCYFLEMSLIITTLYYLKKYTFVPLRAATWYSVLCMGIFAATVGLSWAYYLIHGEAGADIYPLSTVLMLTNIMALMIYAYRPGCRPYTTALVLVSVCILVQLLSRSVVDAEDMRSHGSNAERAALMQGGLSTEGCDGFIRYDYCMRDTMPVSNLAAAYGTPSVHYYHSIRNAKYRDLASAVSHHVDFPLFLFPLRHRESYDALMSVGTIVYPTDLTENEVSMLPSTDNARLDGIFYTADFSHHIPFGFAYDKYAVVDGHLPITDSVAAETDFPAAMLNTLLIRAEDEAELSGYMAKADFDASLPLDSLVDLRRAVTCAPTRATTRGFDTSIDIDQPRVVFFSVAADPGFTAYIDGAPTKIYEVNLGLSAVIVPAGLHNIEFSYFTPGLKAGLILSLIALTITFIIFLTERKRHPLCLQSGLSR